MYLHDSKDHLLILVSHLMAPTALVSSTTLQINTTSNKLENRIAHLSLGLLNENTLKYTVSYVLLMRAVITN